MGSGEWRRPRRLTSRGRSPVIRNADGVLIRLSLPQSLLLVSCQRREQVADHGSRACLDLDRHGHSGPKLDEFLVYSHGLAVERDTSGILQLLTFRLAAVRRRAHSPVIRGALWPVAGDSVRRNAEHFAMKKPIAREVECIELDLRFLPRMHESDVAVGKHGLDIKLALAWNHHGW